MNFIEYLNQWGNLSPNDIRLLEEHLTTETLPKGTHFLKTGEQCSKVGYIEHGINPNGRSVQYTKSSEQLLNDYYKEIEVAFKIADYILVGIRELYFELLSKKVLHDLSLKENSETSARTSNDPPCEYFPSVLVISDGLDNYTTRLAIKAECNAECSNQYCIGCCHYYPEPHCLWGICILYGHGHVCIGSPNGGYYGDCVGNSPCLVDSPT